MRRIMILLAVLLLAGPVWCETWGPFAADYYPDDPTTLTITRTFIPAGTPDADPQWQEVDRWLWEWTLYNGNPRALTWFSAGVHWDDGETGLNAGRLRNYGATIYVPGVEEVGSHIRWYQFTLLTGETAVFSVQTDLQCNRNADYDARDSTFSPSWKQKPAPSEHMPEPGSLTVFGIAVGILALRRRLS